MTLAQGVLGELPAQRRVRALVWDRVGEDANFVIVMPQHNLATICMIAHGLHPVKIVISLSDMSSGSDGIQAATRATCMGNIVDRSVKDRDEEDLDVITG
jgi:hypothetical protein